MAKSKKRVDVLAQIPRDPNYFMQLSPARRKHVYGLLGAPNRKAFGKLQPHEQAIELFRLLLQYDTDKSGFVVRMIALPVRSRSDATNRKRLASTAKEIERALNQFHHEGRRVELTNLVGMGFLVTGFMQPSVMGMVPFQLPVMTEAPGPTQAPDGHVEGAAQAKLQQLAHAVRKKATLQGKVTQKDVNEIVEEFMRGVPAEMVKKLLEQIQVVMQQHEQSHVDRGDAAQCGHITELALLQTSLQARLRVQLS
jgi:hypothetical protein